MYYLKNTLFLDLTKNQKASLIGFLKSFVKKHSDKNTAEILDLFIDDEQYYFEVENPHFEWIVPLFDEEKFLKELSILIKENKKLLELKEKQRPFIEKQKLIAKEQRQKATEFQMSKAPPTKKQIYYYNKLCEKYNIEKENITEKSKLDLKNMIGKILDEHNINIEKTIGKDLHE